MKVVFAHLDLGIGGAEMLVVNAAVAAEEAGHEVVIYTSHHDPRRSFRETKRDGVLGGSIRVRGDWLPRQVLGRFTALCAAVRMLWLALCIIWAERGVDVVFCDGVSVPVPFLRLTAPVLFYCHFPDKLLCVARDSFLKRLYRWPLDMLEEFTTGCSTSVAVNSGFTAGIFREAFPKISRGFAPPGDVVVGSPPGDDEGGARARKGSVERRARRLRVLYPPTNVGSYADRGAEDSPVDGRMGPVVSLNRFERKKDLPLAIRALAWAIREMGQEEAISEKGMHLVIAGGYDDRVAENVEHLTELKELARELGMESAVEFRPNIGDDEKSTLLRRASCVLYTPANEHFGIVPVEAMCSGAPVVAVNSGGPLETIVDGSTGFLCPAREEAFGSAIVEIARDPTLASSMGREGRRRVDERFSLKAFSGAFQASLEEVASARSQGSSRSWVATALFILAAVLISHATTVLGR